jgi:osmoprotectant transport system permease protein
MRIVAFIPLLLFSLGVEAQKTIRVGAKHFNEGYILSEMIAQLLEDGGFKVERKFNLGGSTVSFEALRNNAIDVYPEYTGTIAKEILKEDALLTPDLINAKVGTLFNLEISPSFGFSNTYALLLDKKLSTRGNIKKISDLVQHPELRIGLSYEFIERQDGWNMLAVFYSLPHPVTALEHGLAYQAINEKKIDVTDAYSTDGEIKKYDLVLLQDDRNFFPAYHAVSFYSKTLPAKAKELLHKLTDILVEEEMQQLNGQALFEKKSHYEIAHTFLEQKGLIKRNAADVESPLSKILTKTWQHLTLTFLALLASLLVALPLGILIFRNQQLSKVILYGTGILQTIPSIALLALMIPLFGIGIVPAVIALFIYALLPILRNTVIGLTTVDPILKRVASSIGLSTWNSLKLVEIPLAVPMILAGIRTAAVINVGTATLAAFIGAGGLGEFIVTGLALNNTTMILMGAVPAAILAVITELSFEVIEMFVVPRQLRKGMRGKL